MDWTTAKPTAIGWYWRRDTSTPAYRPVEIVWANYMGPLELWMRDRDEMRPLDNVSLEGGEWSGPLPPPTEAMREEGQS